MTTFIKIPTLVIGGALLTLTACSTAAASGPAKGEHGQKPHKHQMMDGEHMEMMQQMKSDHNMMSKMDMSKMDMSKLSSECQTMMSKMKTKMAEKHKNGSKHSDMKQHDMAQQGDHDMGMMKDHDSEKMKAKMAAHKKCMAEMKEAMPHQH